LAGNFFKTEGYAYYARKGYNAYIDVAECRYIVSEFRTADKQRMLPVGGNDIELLEWYIDNTFTTYFAAVVNICDINYVNILQITKFLFE
jgi:hypothetical protein